MLSADEPAAVQIFRSDSLTPFFFTCDHASNRIPVALKSLGLSTAELERHIAWDIGALPVAHALSERFAAPLVATSYSRLVIDCNRHLWRDDAVPVISELTEIPGNVGLAATEKARRAACFHTPYHRTISELLERRAAQGIPSIYISVHSFTPMYKGEARPWQIAMLSNRDRRLADIFLRELRRDPALTVGDNIPYRLTDEGDYGVPVHAERRGIPHVLIELRQNEIDTPAGQRRWVDKLSPILDLAAHSLGIAVD